MQNHIEDIRVQRPKLVEKELSYQIGGAFFEVYNYHGYGYLESIYARSLVLALQRRELLVEQEVPVVIRFHGTVVGEHRLDILVERRIVLEIKATERIADAHKRQLRNYLTACDLELGLLLHFGPEPAYYRVLRRKKSEPQRSDSANPGHSNA